MARYVRSSSVLLLCLLYSSLFSQAQAQDMRVELNQRMVAAADAFLASLTREQHNRAVYDFDDEERLNWHFIPRSRNGAVLQDMTPGQLEAAHALLRTFFSESGYSQTQAVRNLENVLAEIEVNGMFERNPDLYYLTVFGEPGLDSTWALRYEGHHLAFNWTFVRGLGIASSPQFFGTNPAEVRTGELTGTRVLGTEEDLGRALVTSLSREQARQAILETDVPRDIITGANVDIDRFDAVGIKGSDLSSDQQVQLMNLISEVASVQPAGIYEERMAQVRDDGFENLRFVWIGNTEPGAPHYFRVQGSGFLIEYDNVQNEANHVHLVWRDFDGDFGRDLLQLHYESVAAVNGRGHEH